MIGIYKITNKENGKIYIGSSIYKEVPIYKKSIGIWELNGEPVSTIPETWE